MPTITIDLESEVVELLGAEARRRNVSPEALAEEGIREILSRPDAETRRLIGQIIEENRELYERLA